MHGRVVMLMLFGMAVRMMNVWCVRVLVTARVV
jgi:hypothetical protein